MKYALHRIRSWLNYSLKAQSAHGLHSPFLYQWYEEVLAEKKAFYAFTEIKKIREEIYRDNTAIRRTDYGTGHPKKVRAFGKMAQSMGISTKRGELLFRIVAQHRPKNLLELGTGTGLALHYLSAAAGQKAQIHTLEGCPETSAAAAKYFSKAQENIHFHVGKIQDTLPQMLATLPPLDFVFLDAHHAEAPTLRFTEWLLPKLTENALLVYDDIHWSPEMSSAWRKLVADERLPLTVDLFDFGLAFLRSKQPKQHFTLR